MCDLNARLTVSTTAHPQSPCCFQTSRQPPARFPGPSRPRRVYYWCKEDVLPKLGNQYTGRLWPCTVLASLPPYGSLILL
jgi:hypothetical protein